MTQAPDQQTQDPNNGDELREGVADDSRREVEQVVDPGQQSLADALRVTFFFLKVAMGVVVIVYALSGLFTVSSQEKAVRLFLGEIVGDPGEQVIESEGQIHFALPYPFEEVVRIPSTQQTVAIDTAFFYQLPENLRGATLAELHDDPQSRRPLRPGRDGSLLTADGGLAHARFSVGYRIDDVPAYIRNVGNVDLAAQLVRAAAEQGMVHLAARQPADEFVRQTDIRELQRLIQQSLDDLDTGVRVVDVDVSMSIPPLNVLQAEQELTNELNTRAQRIEEARQERARTLGATAGQAADELWQMISDYQEAIATGNDERSEQLDALLDEAFRSLNTGEPYGGVPISGQVAELVNNAYNFQTSIVAEVEKESETFTAHQQRFEENPTLRRIVMNRMLENTRQRILTGEMIEKIYLPSGPKTIQLSSDPQIRKAREEASMREQEERLRDQANQRLNQDR